MDIHYPVHTHVRLFEASPRKLRHIQVCRVQDLVRQPLTIDEFLHRPFLMRSRWLAKAWDAELKAWRQFYLGSSQEYAAPGQLRLALYELGGTWPVELLGREFNPNVYDRKLMMRLFRRWSEKNHRSLELRVLCDDMRIVT